MNLMFIDWSIIIGMFLFLIYTAFTTRKYTKGVADFVAANRCAGRYFLAISQNTVDTGVVSIIFLWELFCKTGWTSAYWNTLAIPLTSLMALTGFVFYRFRQTRALTLGQFFEMRYGHGFRIYAAVLCWLSGILSFGIFPRVGTEFFMTFCKIPSHIYHYHLFGISSEIDITFSCIMLFLVGISLLLTFIGGQITVLVTSFWQGFFATFVFLAIVFLLWFSFPAAQMNEGLSIASKPGNSLVDPFDISDRAELGIAYALIVIFFSVYQRGASQGSSGYNSCALTPHEAKMAPIVSHLRFNLIYLGLVLIPLVAITYMNHPDFAEKAAQITAELKQSFPTEQHQQFRMMVPAVIAHVLPRGLIGCFVMVMLGFFVCTNNTQMHSWGSIFIQDILCPIKKTPFSAKTHLLILRLAICFVAVFGFVFSHLFQLRDFIIMFLMITSAVFMGGAGSAILGGLYWKRGTKQAAWTAMTLGAVLSLVSIFLSEYTDWFKPWLNANIGVWKWDDTKISFVVALCCLISYILVSMIGPRDSVDLDRILHRGKYAVAEEEEILAKKADHKKIHWFWRMIGVNSHEFSKIDKGFFLYIILFQIVYSMSWTYGLLLFAILGLMAESRWLWFWRIDMTITFVIGFFGVFWVCIGGLLDLRQMYARLAAAKRNEFDDGRVVGDHLLAEEKIVTVSEEK